MTISKRLATILAFAVALTACHERASTTVTASTSRTRPSILLVTLDTTRFDSIGPDQTRADTPSYNALVAKGRRFMQAYATVPQTLPSHASMLTGLYAAGHGLRENGRYLAENQPLVSERLHEAGYRTAAFVSAFAVARRFGLARGFDLYDDEFPKDLAERNAQQTTDRALAFLQTRSDQPLFLWVHYWDPHYPYTPPEPFRTRYAAKPYDGEIAFMDQQLGRLVQAFQQGVKGPAAMIIVGDHGEGLGDHGEQQHGDLLYQATMHVPLLIIGPGVTPGTTDAAVSTRRVFHTILDWAGIDSTNSFLKEEKEVVAGEAMKPFLDYGWQPQVMAVKGHQKAIMAGRLEVYDVVADPGESHDLAAGTDLPRDVRATLRDYPIPSPATAGEPANMDDETRKKLASLGYVSSGSKPVLRPDAPRPADMASLFPLLDEAAALFVRGEYSRDIPLLEKILSKDPHNLDSALRLATAHSQLGHDAEAVAAFKRAEAIAPDSEDVRTYLALHYARGKEWQKAVPLLERIVAASPDRLPAVEALAVIRERQGRIADAVTLRQTIYASRTPSPAELAHLGEMRMALGQTDAAIQSFEKARAQQGAAFDHDLELGVLYMDARRFEDARASLDRVPSSHPAYPLALFKRAQVSVLLHEPDAPARIAAARQHANAMTRELIARERLFEGM